MDPDQLPLARLLQLPQICEQRLALLGHERSIEMNAVGREEWRHNTGRGNDLCAFEQLSVMIDDLFERRGAVVVEIRCRASDAAESGDIELFQSSCGAARPKPATPVNNARPGSELVRRIFEPSGCVIS